MFASQLLIIGQSVSPTPAGVGEDFAINRSLLPISSSEVTFLDSDSNLNRASFACETDADYIKQWSDSVSQSNGLLDRQSLCLPRNELTGDPLSNFGEHYIKIWELVDSLLALIGPLDQASTWMMDEKLFRKQIRSHFGLLTSLRLQSNVGGDVESMMKDSVVSPSKAKKSVSASNVVRANSPGTSPSSTHPARNLSVGDESR